MATQTRLIARDRYLQEALLFRDTDLIKVVTGVRRCGKSSLLALIREQLSMQNPSATFISVNLESMDAPITTADELYLHIKSRLSDDSQNYVFIDEPQRLPNWQLAVNAMRVDFACDLYLTGSNAYLLSSELSTYLSGRYVEIKMLPLSFAEYLDFCGLNFEPGRGVSMSAAGEPVLFDEVFERYLRFGGFPAIASLETTQQMHSAYVAGVFEAIAMRDILNRERAGGANRITDSELLRSLCSYLADNIGNTCSAHNIANALAAGGGGASHVTVQSYIAALNDAFLFYRAPRFDLHGKALLKTQPKQYVTDLGLRSYLGGYRQSDIGRAFENAVYFQLRYEGYSVHVGKLYNKEIDFVAVKDGAVRYVQVCDEMSAEATRERELAPLRAIRDSHEKLVVVRRATSRTTCVEPDGIKIVPAQEFFRK